MNAAKAEILQQKQTQMQAIGISGNRGVLERIDPAKLPEEPTDTFSTVPYEFEESVRYLWDDTQKLYYHACRANRFSENYLLYSDELEKSIRKMGSYCLTKAALEQKGMLFPSLSELSVPELVGMVSYHLRKTHAAFEGIYRDNNRLGLSYLTREFRWVALGNRLKATETKIQKIKDGKLNADELLKQDDFYQPAHREIFEAMRQLSITGQPCDLVTLADELQRRGTLEGVGGDRYLIDLMAGVPSAVNARAYMQIVDEKSTLRRLINASNEIQNDCYAQTETVEKIVNKAEKSIFDIALRRKDSENLIHIAEVLPDTYAKIQHLFDLRGGIDGVPTGFTDLDNLLTGLHGGELVIVGARPSMGKTSFGLNVLSQAAKAGKTVAMFSLEMPNEQLAMRLLCADARVDMQAVRRGTIRDEDWLRLAEALGPLGASNIYIDDTSGISPAQLRSRCRRLMMDKGLDMILVDYLQLMSSDGRAENRQNEVSEISRDLKGIAKELNVPMVALAQLSRAGAQRSDKRPILSDLRDSGAIEQDADVIMFLHREEYYNSDTEDKNVAEVIVAKQRNGPLGTVKLAWLGQFTRFANLQPN